MTAQSPLVTIIGGSGFVGRHIAQEMARRGWRVRVAVRRPNDAMFVKPYGTVGQVEPVQCNIRDEASTRAVIRGADAVVNCVGLLFESGRNTFQACMAEGAGRAARIAAEEGVAQFVQVSALGADPDSASAYARAKAAGEAAVTAAFPGAVILRPSVVFGIDDGFFSSFAGMARLMPLVFSPPPPVPPFAVISPSGPRTMSHCALITIAPAPPPPPAPLSLRFGTSGSGGHTPDWYESPPAPPPAPAHGPVNSPATGVIG